MPQKYDVLLDFKQIHKLKVKRKVHVQGISATNAEPADVIFITVSPTLNYETNNHNFKVLSPPTYL